MAWSNWVPAGLLGLFFAVGVVGRAWVHWRRYGSTGLALFRGGGRDLGFDTLIGVWALAIAAEVVVAGGRPDLLAWAAIPRVTSCGLLGAALRATALVLMLVAQLDMGASWRVGIDPLAKPGLITSGVYRFSRNPIYACLLLALTGLFLLLPNEVSAALALAGWFGVWVQVGREESYLLRTYGEAFRHYRDRVNRFVPGLRCARGESCC